MPVLEGAAPFTGGESWAGKFSAPPPRTEDDDSQAPYPAWHRTWHLHPGLGGPGEQFETTAPVVSSVLLARPWDAPALRTESAGGPMGWRAALEGVTTVSKEAWPFEMDPRSGALKCLACCASAAGACNLPTCALKTPPPAPNFLARGGGEAEYVAPKLSGCGARTAEEEFLLVLRVVGRLLLAAWA